MLRSLLLIFGIVAITCFEFFFYPGHTYLAGESQNLVAMMERLRAPGFLSRDLVAINPNLTYTIYDEVSLFLVRVSGHDFQWVLAAQQLVFRFAGVLGVFLLCTSAGLRSLPALATTAAVGVGASLPGLHLALTDTEPTPFSFAFALTVLAFGFLAKTKPLLAGVFAGLALVYQPSIAFVFWLFVAIAYVVRPSLRPILRATVPAFVVFFLILANAAQLQPGRGESHPLFQRIPETWAQLQRQRTPELWISTWGFGSAVFYLLLAATAYIALRRLWPQLHPLLRWTFAAPLLLAASSMLLVLLGFEVFKWALIGELQLGRTLALAYTVVLVLCAATAQRVWQYRRWEAVAWLIPLLISLSLLRPLRLTSAQKEESRSVRAIAEWAERTTWGGSMFLFPDAGESLAPGQFRGLSMRAIYVDWTGGELTKIFPTFAEEWRERWQEAGRQNSARLRLPELLQLPVEYVVLHRRNALPDVKPEITTPAFVVYDAHVLNQSRLSLGTFRRF